MFCPNCGKVANGRFCEVCGTSLDQDQQTQPSNFQSNTNTQPLVQTQSPIQPQPQMQATTQQPQPQYPQRAQYTSTSSTSPSKTTIIFSGVMPIVGWIMGVSAAVSGNGKKGGFFFTNATVCFFFGVLGVMASYMFGSFGGIIGLAMAVSYISSRAKKVETGEIQLN